MKAERLAYRPGELYLRYLNSGNTPMEIDPDAVSDLTTFELRDDIERWVPTSRGTDPVTAQPTFGFDPRLERPIVTVDFNQARFVDSSKAAFNIPNISSDSVGVAFLISGRQEERIMAAHIASMQFPKLASLISDLMGQVEAICIFLNEDNPIFQPRHDDAWGHNQSPGLNMARSLSRRGQNQISYVYEITNQNHRSGAMLVTSQGVEFFYTSPNLNEYHFMDAISWKE